MSEVCDCGTAKVFAGAVKISEKKLCLKALQCLQHEHLAFHSSCLHCFMWAPKTCCVLRIRCAEVLGGFWLICALTQIEDLILRILNSVCKGKKKT